MSDPALTCAGGMSPLFLPGASAYQPVGRYLLGFYSEDGGEACPPEPPIPTVRGKWTRQVLCQGLLSAVGIPPGAGTLTSITPTSARVGTGGELPQIFKFAIFHFAPAIMPHQTGSLSCQGPGAAK